jgi:hypothetical protein
MLRSYAESVDMGGSIELDNVSLDSSNSQDTPSHDWKEEHEKILIEWADKAMCYRWLHSKANAQYTFLNIWFTIPVIIISTVTGTANFAQDRFGESYKDVAVMMIGAFNIMAGIIQTIQNFLKISELNEAYRISSISWDKFYRNIKIEMAKHPSERLPVLQMFKMCKEEFDRLMETSPNIPEKVVAQFKQNFKHTEEFAKISKPEICDVLISTSNFKYITRESDQLNIVEMEHTKKRQHVKRNLEKIIEFSNVFKKVHGRYPITDEIQEQFTGQMSPSEITKCIHIMDKRLVSSTTESSAPTIVPISSIRTSHPNAE